MLGVHEVWVGGYVFAQRKGLASLRENTMEFVLRYRFENKTNNVASSQVEATDDYKID